MDKRSLNKAVKEYVASNSTQEAIDELNKFAETNQLDDVSNQLIMINSQYAKYIVDRNKGISSDEDLILRLNRINDSLLKLLETKELRSRPIEARVKSNEIIAWQFHKDHSWIPIDVSKKNILRDDFDEHAQRIAVDLDRSGEINFLGLPQVGRSTYLMQLLKSVSGIEGKTVLFIPNQGFSKRDYLNILKTGKYRNTVGKNHIVGLDDFELGEDKKALFPNAVLCVVPNKLSNPYSSQFITPFNYNETEKLLNQVQTLELHPIVLKTIISYSSGFPLLAENLLNFFMHHRSLSIKLILQDKYITKLLDKIYDGFLFQVDEDVWKLWVGLITVGKQIKNFEQSINNKINTSGSALLKQMGFDRVVSSPLLLEYFRLKVGLEQSRLFKKEGVKDFLNMSHVNSIGVWTPNNELKFFDKSLNVIDVAKYIFRSEVLINRIDWNKSSVDERAITSFDEKLNFGDTISFVLGKRNKVKKRSKDYKRLNRKFKELIFLGDSEAKRGNLEKAEKYYLSTKELKYNKGSKFVPDSNYGKVRLANLYRIQGRIEEAEDICLPVVRSTPNPFAYLCLCICKFWKGDFIGAKILVEKSLEYNPTYLNGLLWKVRILLHIQDFELANKILKKIKVKDLGNNSHFIYLMLRYAVAKNRVSNSIYGRPNFWHNKIMGFISSFGKTISRQIIPLVLTYLRGLDRKEREFQELEIFYLSNHIETKGINVDMYWWKEFL